MWFQGKVEVLEHHDTRVRSVKRSFQLPSIIRLKTYVRYPRPRPVIRFSRENVYIRDKYCCQYCGDRFSAKELTLDHVLPVSQGGRKTWTNVVSACRTCNQKKRNRTPEEADMPLLSQPVVPKWLPESELDIGIESIPLSWRIYLYLPKPTQIAVGGP